MKVTFCMLTLNEIDGVKHDVPLIKRVSKSFDEIIDVDNGSTDGTIEYLNKQNIIVYSRPGISYNAMHILAIEKSRADAIIFFHPKGTIPVKDTLKYKKFFEAGYEFVVASRVMRGGTNEEDQKFIKSRKWLTIFLALVAALIWRREGNIIWDVFHGFRGVTKKAFKKIAPSKKGRTVDINGVIEAYRNRIKRIEFPTKEMPRISGETHFKTIPFGIEVLKFMAKKLFNLV